MEKLILKMGPRVPELIARAIAGDVSAMAILAVMGVGAVSMCLKDDK